MLAWTNWISATWPELVVGEKIPVPGWLGHPAHAGFRRIAWSTPEGQLEDWVLSLSDGSRVHVHEFANGRLLAHRDKYDPDAGLRGFLGHLFEETQVGRALLVVGILVVAAKLLESAGRG